ncbi:hypothetical protein [Sulfuricurvum sp.]|uniref:hypothetical protein n=1 Tax=Sulfuricurvum sp. TaxID=2025608 RepID=UPI003565E85D
MLDVSKDIELLVDLCNALDLSGGVDAIERIKRALTERQKPTTNSGSVCASQIAAVINYIEQKSKEMVDARSILNHIYGTLRQLHTCR